MSQIISKEPGLAHVQSELKGAVFYPDDEIGDIAMFTNAMAENLKTKGVKFIYGEEIEGFEVNNEKISHLKLKNAKTFEADGFVVALGAYAAPLLRKIGISLNMYPLKGYSVTIPLKKGFPSPNHSFTDHARKFVITPLKDKIRAAGTVELAGYNEDITEVRINMMIEALKNYFPDSLDLENISKWACLRPSTANGVPFIGPSRYSNLFLNTGHGTLGWTQAAGSAALIAEIIRESYYNA